MNASITSTILRAILRWWWFVVVATAVSVGVGFLVRTEQPDIYVSRATVLVGQDVRTLGTGGFRASRDLLVAYSVFMRRPTLLQPVINDLNLGIQPDDLNAMMTIEINLEAALLEITVWDTDPERAALIANRIAQELINQSSAGAAATGAADQDFIRRELANLQNQIDQLQARYDALIAEAATLESAFDINRNLQESQSINLTLNNLRTLYADYLSSSGEAQRLVQLFEPAYANYVPVVGNNILDLIIAGAVGAGLALVTIVMMVFLDDRFQWSESSQESVQGVRILGPLGIVPGNKLPLYAESAPESLEAEALRQARAKITLAAPPDVSTPRVITFVSGDSGDGKTLTTVNMALTYARSGESTIVIDGDIRKGDMHELFGMPNVTGLAEVLGSREPVEQLLSQSILQTGYPNLALLPCGRLANDPAALFSSPRLGEMVKVLRAHYDMVIFDSAPVIAGHDAVFLGEESDGVVVVVNARRTTQTGLRRTLAILNEGENLYILGLLVNRVRLQVTSKYNSTYYRHTQRITKDQLSRELLSPSRSALNPRANVIAGGNGERLYSTKASAARLGVRPKTVHQWARTGYIKTQRRGWRKWVSESEIERVLQTLPVTQERFSRPMPVQEAKLNGGKTTTTGPLVADNLREQRDAVLGFARKPGSTEEDEN